MYSPAEGRIDLLLAKSNAIRRFMQVLTTRSWPRRGIARWSPPLSESPQWARRIRRCAWSDRARALRRAVAQAVGCGGRRGVLAGGEAPAAWHLPCTAGGAGGRR